MDETLRRLERQAALGDLVAMQKLTARRVGIAGRDPRRDPAPGDVVVAQPGTARRFSHGRRVATCEQFREAAIETFGFEELSLNNWSNSTIPWLLRYAFRLCFEGSCGTRVHWLRTVGKGHRFGLIMPKSWRAWARGACVVETGSGEERTETTLAETVRRLAGYVAADLERQTVEAIFPGLAHGEASPGVSW